MLPTRQLEQRRVLDELEAWLADLPDSVQVGIVPGAGGPLSRVDPAGE
jgi:hypothetical protein